MLQSVLAAAMLLCGLAAQAALPVEDAPAESPFSLRVVKLGGTLGSEAVRRHLEFSVSIGFNAIWVPSSQAGSWTRDQAPSGPFLTPEFLELAGLAEARGIRIVLVFEPVLDSADTFVFSDNDSAKRALRFLRLARRDAGVHDLVVSFHGAPLRLTELSDLLEYGRIAAAAHIELMRKIERKMPSTDRVWFAPSIFAERHLNDPRVRYSSKLLEELAILDSRVGIVWSGPEPVSPSITAADLARTRRRLGGRSLLLEDRYPANGSGERMPLGLVLGPLRERDPAIVAGVSGYVCSPMTELGASRLVLLTVADFLRDPERYDPDASWNTAIARLAGDNTETLRALRTQAMEWGGWVETLNYHTALNDNPRLAATELRDPARVASWTWTVKTYPARITALEAIPDEAFRAELLLTMARRLAVARSVPIVHDLLSSGGRSSDAAAEDLLNDLRLERARVADRPLVLAALDRFLSFAGAAKAPEPISANP